jgi:hypothetical protein
MEFNPKGKDKEQQARAQNRYRTVTKKTQRSSQEFHNQPQQNTFQIKEKPIPLIQEIAKEPNRLNLLRYTCTQLATKSTTLIATGMLNNLEILIHPSRKVQLSR